MKVLAWRRAQIAKFELRPALLNSALTYYATRPVEWINHWFDTYDPRNAGSGKPVHMPLVLFPRQQEFVEFLMGCLRDEQNGLVEKSRDMGATWVACAVSIYLWRFWSGSSVGWGSRKKELVDRIGDPDSIFEKLRMGIMSLPRMFWPRGLNPDDHLTSMRLLNPENGASITGEVGDNIGRGGRKLIYFKDESAHYEHPEAIEAALSDNTRVQIDISSVHGLNNIFHRKREAGMDWVPGRDIPRGTTRVFVMDWRDHPMKTDAWYAERKSSAEVNGLKHVFAQEVDRDYAASIVGTIILSEWVKSAIDAHVKLGIPDTGMWGAALDVSDEEGQDRNALVKRKGIVLRFADEWNGIDTGKTARRAVEHCSGLGEIEIQYDCIGVGAGVKAEANRLAEESLMPKDIYFTPWNAGAGVEKPDEHVIPSPTGRVGGDTDSPLNKDFYKNLKAQGWWELRSRFYRTHRCVTAFDEAIKHGLPRPALEFDPDTLISIDSALPLLRQIEKELSQPTASKDTKLKLVVDKTPEGTKSPNVGDAVMMAYFPLPRVKPLHVSRSHVSRAVQRGRRR